MEHRLIQGGTEYLPFARSCVAKLKKLGMPYASQQYEVNGVSIKVRIEPGHEYIRIEGGTEIFSGVVRGGEVVSLANEETGATFNVLRTFKPTPNTWRYPLHKSVDVPTTAFSDMKKLANVAAPYDTQYADLSPSSYSGLMAKAVAIIMARGLPVKYYYNWGLCHGIVLASDGKPWLVEISPSKVLAMKLPMDAGNISSKCDAEAEITKLLGGVPNGGTFPNGPSLNAAQSEGRVIELSVKGDIGGLNLYFGKSHIDDEIGWSFNDDGSEAQNVCVAPDKDGLMNSHLYRLVIRITPGDETSTATGDVTINELERGPMTTHGLFGWIPFVTSEGPISQVTRLSNYDAEMEGTAPLFVCFQDGVFDVVRYKAKAVEGTSAYVPVLDYMSPAPIVDHDYYAGTLGGRVAYGNKGTSSPHPRATRYRNERISGPHIGTEPLGGGGVTNYVYRSTRYDTETGFLFTLKGCRDGYGVVHELPGVDIRVRHHARYFADAEGFAPTLNPGAWGVGADIVTIDPGTSYPEEDAGYGADVGYFTGVQHFYGNGFIARANTLAGVSKMRCTIFSRYQPPIALDKANKAGEQIHEHTTFRFNVFGPDRGYAFITEEYGSYYTEYENHVRKDYTTCGVTHLGGAAQTSETPVVGVKYNFIGYVK